MRLDEIPEDRWHDFLVGPPGGVEVPLLRDAEHAVSSMLHSVDPEAADAFHEEQCRLIRIGELDEAARMKLLLAYIVRLEKITVPADQRRKTGGRPKSLAKGWTPDQEQEFWDYVAFGMQANGCLAKTVIGEWFARFKSFFPKLEETQLLRSWERRPASMR